MLENRIESILNNSASFGKLNAILFFNASQTHFDIIYKDLLSLFQPVEINSSIFDLKNMEMKEIDISIPQIYSQNSIIKIIFSRKMEKIILECYRGNIIIEHLLKTEDIKIVNGYSIIEKYYNQNNNSILVIGYELSINIDSYEESLKEHITDNSLYPIFVAKNINGQFELNGYTSDNSKVNKQKVKHIQEYLKATKLKLM